MNTTINLGKIHLLNGNHDTREAGMCVMEAAAYIANEPHSDSPICVAPEITAFMIYTNDSICQTDQERDEYLKPLIPILLKTRTTDLDITQKRAFLFADYAVRVLAAMAMESAGLNVEAEKLRSLDEIVDISSAKYAAESAKYAAEYAAKSAKSAESAEYAAKYAAKSAKSHTKILELCCEVVRKACAIK